MHVCSKLVTIIVVGVVGGFLLLVLLALLGFWCDTLAIVGSRLHAWSSLTLALAIFGVLSYPVRKHIVVQLIDIEHD